MSDVDMTKRARALAEAFDQSFAAPARVQEDEPASALAVRIGGDPYVLMTAGLASVSRRPTVVPLPGGPPVQLGLSGIAGRIVTVFSLPALLGYDVALSEVAWVAVVAGHRAIALAFEGLEEQIAVPQTAVSAAPSGGRRHVSGLVRVGAEEVPRGLVDLPSLLARLDGQAV